jgi:predicted nucleic acid-binding protein
MFWEMNSELANSVVKGAEDLLVSDLTVAEFLVALARKVKLGTHSQERSMHCLKVGPIFLYLPFPPYLYKARE